MSFTASDLTCPVCQQVGHLTYDGSKYFSCSECGMLGPKSYVFNYNGVDAADFDDGTTEDTTTETTTDTE